MIIFSTNSLLTYIIQGILIKYFDKIEYFRDLKDNCDGEVTDCQGTVTTYFDLVSVAAPGSSSGGGSSGGGSSGGNGNGNGPPPNGK